MKELNCHPNSRARNFANGITNTIALVIDAEDENTFANTFFNRSVYAIERVAQKNGYNLLITNDMDEKGSSITSLVYEKKVDGLIFPSSSIRKELTDLLEKEQFPFVVLGEPEEFPDRLDWVDINNYEGGKKRSAICLSRDIKGPHLFRRKTGSFLQGEGSQAFWTGFGKKTSIWQMRRF